MPPKQKGMPPQAFKDEPSDEDVELEEDDDFANADVRARLAKCLDPVDYSRKFVSRLPLRVRRRALALVGMQKDLDELKKQYLDELEALEIKYHRDIYPPHYVRRLAVLNGDREPTDEEVVAGAELAKLDPHTLEVPPKVEEVAEKLEGLSTNPAEGEAAKAKPKEDFNKSLEGDRDQLAKTAAEGVPDAEKGIPGFWLYALDNCDATEELIQPRDRECLKHLVDISCRILDGSERGFELIFTFSDNEWFTDKTLTKKYVLEAGEDIVIDKVTGCEIHWNEGKNLSKEKKQQKQKKKGPKGKGKQTRIVEVEVDVETFFNFFSPPSMDEEEDEEDDDTEQLIENDFEIGRAIKNKVIHAAATWFTGSAIPKGQFGPVDAEGDEDDDDDADEEGHAHPGPKKGDKPGAPPAAGEPGKQDEQCKNQ